MTYNWPKIVQGKSVRELYSIARGETMLPVEAVNAAKQELEDRGLNLHDTKRIHHKMELESLIEEQEEGKGFLGRLFFTTSRVWLRQLLLGIFITAFCLFNLMFNFAKIDWKYSLLSFLFTLSVTVYNYYRYKKTRQREQFIRNKIAAMKEKE